MFYHRIFYLLTVYDLASCYPTVYQNGISGKISRMPSAKSFPGSHAVSHNRSAADRVQSPCRHNIPGSAVPALSMFPDR